MAQYKNNYFEGQTIKVDGHAFIGNTFKDCQLVYGGGPLNFSGNTLNNTHWDFVEHAGRTVALLGSLYQQEGYARHFVEYLLSNVGKSPEPPNNKQEKPEASTTPKEDLK